jgi:hypothetical protein
MTNTQVRALAGAGASFLLGGDFTQTTTFGAPPGAQTYTSLGSTDLFVARMKFAK